MADASSQIVNISCTQYFKGGRKFVEDHGVWVMVSDLSESLEGIRECLLQNTDNMLTFNFRCVGALAPLEFVPDGFSDGIDIAFCGTDSDVVSGDSNDDAVSRCREAFNRAWDDEIAPWCFACRTRFVETTQKNRQIARRDSKKAMCFGRRRRKDTATDSDSSSDSDSNSDATTPKKTLPAPMRRCMICKQLYMLKLIDKIECHYCGRLVPCCTHCEIDKPEDQVVCVLCRSVAVTST